MFWVFKPPMINKTFSKAWPCDRDPGAGETPRLGVSKTQTVLAACGGARAEHPGRPRAPLALPGMGPGIVSCLPMAQKGMKGEAASAQRLPSPMDTSPAPGAILPANSHRARAVYLKEYI